MAYVTVINEHQHVQQIVSGHHHLTADEAVAAGGSDAGFAPRELLLASLGADTAVALRSTQVTGVLSATRSMVSFCADVSDRLKDTRRSM